jgi:hypothetical protein
MNLLDYLRKEVVETARQVVARDLIRVYAPDDPKDVRRMVRTSQDFQMRWFHGSGLLPKAGELLSIHALAETIRGGAKVIKPSVDVCLFLRAVSLNIYLSEYAQPYEGMAVVIPRAVAGTSTDLFTACHWQPGLGIHVATHIDDYLVYQTIGPHWPHTIEEDLGVSDGFDDSPLVDRPDELGRRIARIALNLGLFGVDRGVREVPLDPKAQWRRKRAGYEQRFAELSARDAQEVVIQDLDLIVASSSAHVTQDGEGGGWHQRPHRRRGHWKMQPCGPARSQQKRIFVPSYLVNVGTGTEVQTVLT